MGPKKLKEFAPKVDQRSAVGVGAEGNSGWDVLGAGPKANLCLPVDEKRGIFLPVTGNRLGYNRILATWGLNPAPLVCWVKWPKMALFPIHVLPCKEKAAVK